MKTIILIVLLCSVSFQMNHYANEGENNQYEEDKEDLDPDLKNNSQNTDSGQQSSTCNQELMISYGLVGTRKPNSRKHSFCPGIQGNCCTKEDEKTQMFFWKNEVEDKIERYYELYLYLIKYFLGYSEEGFLLAREFVESNNQECKEAANEYLNLNMNPKLAMEMYKAAVRSLEKMSEIRKGFYCLLCDSKSQSLLKDYYFFVNAIYSDRIYFSRQFCDKLVEYTIRSSYFTVNYMKIYLDQITKLMTCKTGGGNTATPVFEISWLRKQQVKNCFFFRNSSQFFFCENYCEKFHLTRPSDILDGDLKNFKNFFEFFRDNRKNAFVNPRNNLLMSGLTFEESYIQTQMEDLITIKSFFSAGSSTQVRLDEFVTDVVYSGGMDPWEPARGAKFPMIISGVSILKFGVTLLILIYVLI